MFALPGTVRISWIEVAPQHLWAVVFRKSVSLEYDYWQSDGVSRGPPRLTEKVRIVIWIGGGKWRCYWWYEPDGSPRFNDDLWARTWLQQFQADGFSVAALRSMLARDQSTGLQALSDEEVLQLIAHKLVSGEIRVSRSQPEDGGALTPREEEASPLFPLSERRAPSAAGSASSPYDEEAVFSSNADLVAIAGVLTDAARLGTPF
jgi:hypothetical protein